MQLVNGVLVGVKIFSGYGVMLLVIQFWIQWMNYLYVWIMLFEIRMFKSLGGYEECQVMNCGILVEVLFYVFVVDCGEQIINWCWVFL